MTPLIENTFELTKRFDEVYLFSQCNFIIVSLVKWYCKVLIVVILAIKNPLTIWIFFTKIARGSYEHSRNFYLVYAFFLENASTFTFFDDVPLP